MARKPRIWFPGAMYHITCRGNNKAEIFWDDEDREYYCILLHRIKSSHRFTLHAYCLMNNHVHLLLETQDIEIGKIMKRINMLYSIFFNHKYDFVGQLLQGRYKSDLIKGEAHYLKVTGYIHLNPVKANIVKLPEDYPWSSYAEFTEKKTSRLADVDKTLSLFSEPRIDGYKAYLQEQLQLASEINVEILEGQTPFKTPFNR